MERNLIQMPDDNVFLIALDIEQVPAEHVKGELFRLSEITSTDQIKRKIHNV